MSKTIAIRTTARDQVLAATNRRNFHREGMLESVLHALLNGAPLPAALSGLSLSRDQSCPQRIAIPDSRGIEMVNVDRYLCAVASSNYCELHLHGGQRHMISRTLKDIEADLPEELFIRIHASHLVALSAITRYIRGSGGTVVLANGEQCPVSRAKKEELLERLGAHSSDLLDRASERLDRM